MSFNKNANLDVTTLLDRSDLDAAVYKTFEPGESGHRTRPVEPVAAPPVNPNPIAPSTAIESYARAVIAPREDERGVVMEAASQMLLKALDGGAAAQGEASWEALPVSQCMTMTSAVGGAGVTTILAEVAAALAAHGERVIVVDRGPSILPFHFGGRSFRSAPVSFMPQGRSSKGPIHLVTGAAQGHSDEWLLQGVTEFQRDADRILVACRPGMSREARQWAAKAPAVVLLLTPDPVSLLRLPAALEGIRQAAEEQACPTLLLLNQFDAANSLHAEVRLALSQQFGEGLLPFVIRRDDVFAQCLAAGGTVAELMPDSRAADDIRSLVEWLRNHGSTPEF